MKSHARRTLILLVSVIFVATLIAGCQEEGISDDAVRKSKLIASENVQLKKQLETCQSELEKQKVLIEKYKQQKGAPAVDLSEMMGGMMQKLAEQNRMLIDENESLKQQLQQK